MSSYYQPRRRQEIKSQSEEIRDMVRCTFSWIWRPISGLIYLFFSFICLLRYLNFIPYLLRAVRRISNTAPPQNGELRFGLSETVVYRASLSERLINIFKSEESKKTFLLSWVQKSIPDQDVRDFTTSWCSGVPLCALAEATDPGTCPRYDLLLPDQAVNNCRLGMKLIRKSFRIAEPCEPMLMAHPLYTREDVMFPYIAMIRYAGMIPKPSITVTEKMSNKPRSYETESKILDIQECLATGSGLVTAIVGRKAKFNVAKPSYIKKKLVVEIEGPNGETVQRLIEDFDSRRPSSDDLAGILSRAGRYNNNDTAGAIEFDYQKVKEGFYQISYIPPSVGKYHLSVLWGGEHTTNSPFSVDVVETKSSSMSKKSVSFSSNTEDSLEISSYKESSPSYEGSTNRERRQSLFRQCHVSSSFKESNMSTTSSSSSMNQQYTSRDFSRTPSLFTTSYDDRVSPNSTGLNRSGSILSPSGDRQGQPRIRRRVIKRVVKGPDGKDEVYYPCSIDRSMTQRSSTMGSLSLSLSVSCDDRFSPNPSRSPSPSPVFLAPVPTLASLERQIHNFADRCSQQILGKAFYDLSKDIVFAATKRESMTKVLKVEPKVKHTRPSLTETQDTTSSSFLDGLSIKTDSIVDDVFETNTSCESIQKEESNNQYEILRPISELASSMRRYQDTFGRPRYESETYFRPISAGNPDIPQLLTRKSKYRSLSESDNMTSVETNKVDNELIPSPSSCFKPVSRKFEFEFNSQTPTDTDYTDEGGKLEKGGVVNGHLRHPKLKSRRRVKKNVTDQETQCSADEIKRVTGWISRRERFKSVHHMKEVESKDFIFSKDGASISLLTSLQEGSPTTDSKTVTNSVSKVTTGHVDLSRTRAVSEPAADHDVQRPQVQPRSKSVAKQSTIDSGYSDENGHSCGNQPIRPETSAHPEGTESPTKRSSPDGVNRPPSEDQLVKSENSDNFDSQMKVVSSTKEELNLTSDVLQLIKSENTSDRQNKDPTLSETLLNRNEKDLSIDSLPRRNPNLGIVVNGYVSSQSDTIDKTHPFGSYWEELLYHLENDPTFPVQEFINRVKSISMDIECNQTPPDVDLATTKEESGHINGQTEGNESPESKQLSPQRVPVKPNCCRAQGCGIQSGIVGSKNNFQVNTQGGGDGSLGVSIRGPRKHTVTECSVIYTGDDFYEVLYEVSLAGFYVISVKWSDRHITDSPFIVKVSF